MPNTTGKKYGGRKVGTPNKRSLEIADQLKALGCDPIEGMAKLAMDESMEPRLRGRMYSEACPVYRSEKKSCSAHNREQYPRILATKNGSRLGAPRTQQPRWLKEAPH